MCRIAIVEHLAEVGGCLMGFNGVLSCGSDSLLSLIPRQFIAWPRSFLGQMVWLIFIPSVDGLRTDTMVVSVSPGLFAGSELVGR